MKPPTMIEQVLKDAPIQREIMVRRDGAIYVFTTGKYALLTKLRSYLFRLDWQGLIRINYISDIHRHQEESYSFTLVLEEDSSAQRV